MRPHLLLLAIAFTACASPHADPEQPAVPEVFQDHSVLQDVKRSSGYRDHSDLVEALFAEELKRDTALAALVERLRAQARSHLDSIAAINDYQSRNTNYYAQASQHEKEINDSLLSAPILKEVEKNKARYVLSVAEHEQWMQRYDSIAARTSDLLEVIKLKRTMRIMRAYQESNRPSADILEKEAQHITALERELMKQLGD